MNCPLDTLQKQNDERKDVKGNGIRRTARENENLHIRLERVVLSHKSESNKN